MLSIVNLLKKKIIIKTNNEKGQSIRIKKKNIAANKEWVNSVYSFNNNSIRFLPAVQDSVFKLLRGYFNLLGEKLKEKLTTKKQKKIHRLSTGKIWISTPEIKHLSEKLYITVYVYNRIYNIYKRKLELLEFDWGPNIILSDKKVLVKSKKQAKETFKTYDNLEFPVAKKQAKESFKTYKSINFPLANNTGTFRIIKIKKELPSEKLKYNTRSYSTKSDIYYGRNKFNLVEYLSKAPKKTQLNYKQFTKFRVTKKIKTLRQLYPTYTGKNFNTKSKYTEMIKWLKLDKIDLVKQYKSNLLGLLDNKREWIKQLENLKLERHNYLINLFTKELAYLRLKQNMLFNQFKFSEIYLTPMINFLQTIYKKKVVVNIVAIKYYYLNTSILSQIIIKQSKEEKFRGRLLSVVDRARSVIRVPALGSTKLPRIEKKFIGMQNVILDNFRIQDKKKDYIEQFILTENALSHKRIHKSVVKNLENKVIGGLFIKISGRLTKRYRADRALSKLRSKGTLRNVYSAHKGFSSNLSRGYSNINVEKTIMHSRLRIGAYGLTGWIASY